MSIPPSRRSSSTPPSKGHPHETDKNTGQGKEFRLPPRQPPVESKDKDESHHHPKKKGVFDIAATMEVTVQPKNQGMPQEFETLPLKTDSLAPTEAIQQVKRIAQLIQQTVETMHIGQLDQQSYASLQLKTTPELPPSFAGSNLTISYVDNGLIIRFDNFMTPQQQNTAITLVEKNKEQLQNMVQTLNSKNIQVAELIIGEHTVTLPKIQPPPPPFQTTSPSNETEQQRDSRGGNEGEGEQDESR